MWALTTPTITSARFSTVTVIGCGRALGTNASLVYNSRCANETGVAGWMVRLGKPRARGRG